jgi:hypothetical protein
MANGSVSAAFIAAAFAGIIARVLQEMGMLNRGKIEVSGHCGGKGSVRRRAASTASRDDTGDFKKQGCHPFWLQPRRVSFSMPSPGADEAKGK